MLLLLLLLLLLLAHAGTRAHCALRCHILAYRCSAADDKTPNHKAAARS
jgi:hypothetical protein